MKITHLSPKMKKFYKKLSKIYSFEEFHLELLLRACESFDRAEQAREILEREGLTIVDRYGACKSHPAVKIENDCKNSARLLLKELNLNTDEV